MRNEITNGIISISVDSLGSQLRSLKADGCELLWQGDPKLWADTAPLLFPICSSLRNNKYRLDGKEYSLDKHGFASSLVFTPERVSDTCLCMSVTDSLDTLEKYPYRFKLDVIFTLDGRSLITEYRVENRNDRDMYFSIGAHEGYACPGGVESCELHFNRTESFESCDLDGDVLGHTKTKVHADGKILPLKNEFFEIDALIFNHVNSDTVTLVDKFDGSKKTVCFSGFENLLIWSMPDAPFVCIEPWCGFPDHSDSDGDFTEKNGIQKIPPRATLGKIHTITV